MARDALEPQRFFQPEKFQQNGKGAT